MRPWALVAARVLTACDVILPLGSPGSPVADTLSPCGTASPTCWDVSAVFSKTDVEWHEYSPQIFNTPVADGQTVYALLDGTSDDTYAEPLFFPSGQCTNWEPAPFNTPRTWDIERKRIDPGKYRILVRGSGDADCNYGPIQPECSGDVEINLNRGWKIINEISCSVTTDTVDSNGVLIPTYCKVDQAGGKISWRSGSSCGGCCACPRGASVNIEVVVSG